MTITASAQIAIREKALKFGWCHSSSPKHFRQVSCYLEGKGVCSECASALCLKVVDVTEIKLVEVKNPEANKKRKRTRTTGWSKIEEKVYRYLKDTCLSSKELYRLCKDNRSYTSFTNFLRSKVHQGLLVADRRKSHHHMVYTVAANLELLQQQLGEPPVEERVLLVLRNGPLGIREIILQTQKTKPTIYSAIKRLEEKRLISTTLLDSGKGAPSLLCSLVVL